MNQEFKKIKKILNEKNDNFKLNPFEGIIFT